ncbi:MAG: MoaD/ThiS family protein [Candidatus Bathyarchaeota archaeon]|nr:MoaD/ThiS family protein [Candidatus Bathyarchaeota archaeon]
MTITVKFVGALRHLSGKTQFTLNLPADATIKDAVEEICRQLPNVKHVFSDQTLNSAQSNSLVLVNGKEISVLAGYQTKLRDGDEVVFVPVVHGG